MWFGLSVFWQWAIYAGLYAIQMGGLHSHNHGWSVGATLAIYGFTGFATGALIIDNVYGYSAFYLWYHAQRAHAGDNKNPVMKCQCRF